MITSNPLKTFRYLFDDLDENVQSMCALFARSLKVAILLVGAIMLSHDMHFCTKKIVLAASDTRYLIDQHIAV